MKIVIDYYIPKKKEDDRSHRFEVWNHGEIDLAVESDSLLPILSVALAQLGVSVDELVKHEIEEIERINKEQDLTILSLETEAKNKYA